MTSKKAIQHSVTMVNMISGQRTGLAVTEAKKATLLFIVLIGGFVTCRNFLRLGRDNTSIHTEILKHATLVIPYFKIKPLSSVSNPDQCTRFDDRHGLYHFYLSLGNRGKEFR
jgi:hypothetical protein